MNCTGRLHTAGGVGYKHAGVLLSLLTVQHSSSWGAANSPHGARPPALLEPCSVPQWVQQTPCAACLPKSTGSAWECHGATLLQQLREGVSHGAGPRCALKPSGEQGWRLGPLRWGCWWSRAVFRALGSRSRVYKGMPPSASLGKWCPGGCVKGCQVVPPLEFPPL